MPRAFQAAVQGRLSRLSLAGLLTLSLVPPVWAGTSTQTNPKVTFATPGDKIVSLEVCNFAGCTTVNKTIKVLDPKPVVTSAVVSPLLVEAGQIVRLTGTGTGMPPLSYDWRVLLGTDLFTTVSGGTSLSGGSAAWNTSGVPAGVYTLNLRLGNAVDTADSLPAVVTVTPAKALDFYVVDPPCRVFDSRLSVSPLFSGATRVVQVTGLCGVPAEARAIAANVTVVEATGAGNVSVYQGNIDGLDSSTLHFQPWVNRANNATLQLSTDGLGFLKATPFVSGVGASVGLVIDVFGYYVPEPAV